MIKSPITQAKGDSEMNTVAIICLEAQVVPEWVRLLPLGEVKLVDGREPFTVDSEALEAIIHAWRARGTDLVIDYEHQTLGGGKAPAAGWIKDLEIREDGLWGRVEWTAAARAHLEAREYRYFSPVLNIDVDTRRPTSLMNLALTNTPAIRHIPPLVAKEGRWLALADREAAREAQAARSQRYGIAVKSGGNVTKPGEWENVPDEQWGDPVNYRYPMPDKAHARNALARWGDAANRREYTGKEQTIITNRIRRRAKALGIEVSEEERGKIMLEKLKEIMGLAPEAAEPEVLKELEAWRGGMDTMKSLAEIMGMREDATYEQVRSAVLALKQGRDKNLERISQELEALKVERQKEMAERMVEKALKAGKLIPAQREWAIQYALKDEAGFRTFVEMAPKVVPLGEAFHFGQNHGGGAETAGLPPDQALALKAQEIAGKEKVDLAEATRRAYAENPELVLAWQEQNCGRRNG